MIDRTSGLDVVFDGRCGVCTRAALWLARRDRRGRLRLHPYQHPGVLERFGLSEAAAHSAAWAFAGEGSRARSYRGAAAIDRALDEALGVKVFLPLYLVPGVRWVQDRVYRWVAENRYRLRGVTPWCEQHPGDCGEASGAASCAF